MPESMKKTIRYVLTEIPNYRKASLFKNDIISVNKLILFIFSKPPLAIRYNMQGNTSFPWKDVSYF